MKLNNLFIRTLTGILFVTLIIGSIFLSKYVFAGLFLIISILGLFEFFKLSENLNVKPQKTIGIIIGAITYIIICSYLLNMGRLSNIFLSLPMLFPVFIFELFRNKENPFMNIAFTIMGIIYIVFPLALLNWLYFFTSAETKYPEIVLMLFFIIWMNDTGAYLTGSIIGKHKLFERISPKKTWEGFAGGILLALILAYLISPYFTYYSPVKWIGFAVVIALSSTFGDLAESLLKRSAGVKDSGNIFPGHGGILDRFDSVFLAVPFGFAYIFLIEYFK